MFITGKFWVENFILKKRVLGFHFSNSRFKSLCLVCGVRLLIILFEFCCTAGCQEDIDSLIRETSDSTQLATWCVVYKAELARKRSECHRLTESLRKAKRELELTQSKFADQTTDLSVANGRIAVLEDDIASQVCRQQH